MDVLGENMKMQWMSMGIWVFYPILLQCQEGIWYQNHLQRGMFVITIGVKNFQYTVQH